MDTAGYPWSYPVRLRHEPGASTPYDGVEALCVRVRAEDGFRYDADFGAFVDSASAPVGHADFQVMPRPNRDFLGSGRSLYFRDHYLKGVGVTPLRGDTSGDPSLYHSTGHMLPSGAVREYLVSKYLTAHGMADAIVPCVAVTFYENDTALRGAVRRMFPEVVRGRRRLDPAWCSSVESDLRLRALSIKPGDFIRHSNLLWAMRHILTHDPLDSLLVVLRAMASHASSEGETSDDIEDILRAFAAALTRAFDLVLHANLVGVRWGSVRNNFALDGRFVDLEMASVWGGPSVAGLGVLLDNPNRALGTTLGLEALLVLSSLREFVTSLVHFVKRLEMRASGAERRSIREVAGLAERLLRDEHPLFDDGAVEHALTRSYADTFRLAGAPAAEANRVERAVRGMARAYAGRREKRVTFVRRTPRVLEPEYATRGEDVVEPAGWPGPVSDDAKTFRDAFGMSLDASSPKAAAVALVRGGEYLTASVRPRPVALSRLADAQPKTRSRRSSR